VPYTKEHKARTRARIVESARVLFNRRGFAEVTLDEIMAHAGLTRGGFYNHFRSKDELYAAAVASFTACNPFLARVAREPVRPSQKKLARMLVELYLSDEILRNVDGQCPLYALPSDVARAGKKPRRAYTDLVRNMRGVFEAALPRGRVGARKADLIVSLCVGGMTIARTTDDTDLARDLRASARAQALALLGP
jgi:TetR/AcrR family transcriptional repressor of nem operon